MSSTYSRANIVQVLRIIKADSLYKYNSTKTFDSKTELYWDEMEQIWFCKKVGKLGIEYLPLWKNFSILYHIHGILNLVLAGNSNVVEITKVLELKVYILSCLFTSPVARFLSDFLWFEKKRNACPALGLNPGPLACEASVLTILPLPLLTKHLKIRE